MQVDWPASQSSYHLIKQLQINEDCGTRIKHSNKKTNSSLGYHIIYNLQHMVPNNLVSTN